MKIRITSKISESICSQRNQLGITQTVLARNVGISQQALHRIEQGINKTCDKDTLKKIYHYLQLDITEITGSESVIKSYRMPVSVLAKLQEIQKNEKIPSETQTLIHCLESYFSHEDLTKIKFEIEEIVEDIIVKTFAKEMKKMNRDIEKYKSILAMIEEMEHINVQDYTQNYDEKLYGRIHAERMK